MDLLNVLLSSVSVFFLLSILVFSFTYLFFGFKKRKQKKLEEKRNYYKIKAFKLKVSNNYYKNVL